MNITNKENRQVRTDTFIGVFIALVIFFIALRIPFDTDFFWHLNAGKVMVNQQSILLTDLFSFTKFNGQWTNHSWLSQILFYLTYKFSGYVGVMIFVAIVTTATMILIYKSMVGKSILKAFLIIFALLISAVVWSPRPQIFSLLCFAILYQFITKFDKTINRKYLFFIGFLFLFWSNLHAGFSLGILFVFLYILGKIIDLVVDYEKYKSEKIKIKLLVILLAFCIVIVCLNPNGINTWKVQFDTVSIGTLQNQIDEWASPDFHKIEQQPYLWIWLLFVLFLSVTTYKFRFQEILPILAFGALGFIAKRNYAIFAILIFPSLSKIIVSFFENEIRTSYFFRNWKSSVEKFNVIPKPIFQKIVNICFIILAGLAIILKIIYLGNELVLATYEKKLYPAEAIDFLNKNPIPDGNLLNSYAWGGYINWKNPNLLVFVDGRTDLFGDEILGDWIKLVNSESGYKDLLLKYDIGWVFLEKDLPIIRTLINEKWQVFYSDSYAVILKK